MLGGLGYGKDAAELGDESLGDFLYHIPDYEQKLAEYPAEDNSAIQRKLDELLADDSRWLANFIDEEHPSLLS